jgi:hypothetical protein
MKLEKYSIGIGDRFGMEGAAQLRALAEARTLGVDIVPVWNKSNREHTLIGTSPENVRLEADAAVKALGWRASYYVDADHIGLATVDKFISSSDFYTIDVADYIGKPAGKESTDAFLRDMSKFTGSLRIPGVDAAVEVTQALLTEIAQKYLYAIEEAGKVYRHIVAKKGAGKFVAEVSVDEADKPQSPIELFFILAAIAREKIAIQTIAPKFTGSFLKGIDYVGDIRQFAREFEDDISVIAFAVKTFGLPENCKLSVHSGSDKFSLYPLMHAAITRHKAGLHPKTAGTTWLEEVIGLAASGKDGLALAAEIYAAAFGRFDELAKPYLPVIQIDRKKLPDPREVAKWDAAQFVDTLRHDQSCRRYSIHFRQLVHIGFRIAAEMGATYTQRLTEYRAEIEKNVTENLLARHIRPLFLGHAAD